jgi:MFS family permease
MRTSLVRAWYAVGFLMLLYCLSYVDRYILALLAAPISESLAIPDVHMGVLFGLGFGTVYALAGLPLAHLIDRGSRVPLVAGGVLLWSISTVLSGYSSGFYQLLICRSGVAIGEAVLTPAAISIIGDMFAREKRTLPTSCYLAIAGFMQAGAFVVGGFAVDVATGFSSELSLDPWRLTLLLVGAPGLVLAPLFFFTVREPARTHEPRDYGSTRQAASYLWRERALFGWMFVGMATFAISGAGFLAWTSTLLIRAFDQSAAETGYRFGSIGLVAAVIGAVAWPLLIGLGNRVGLRQMPVILLAIGLGVAAASFAAVGAATSLQSALWGVGVAMFGISASGILPPLIVQNAAPSRMRGRLIAINLMASSLFGLAIGPPLTAAVAEAFYTGPQAIGYAMAATAAFCGPVATIAILLTRRRYVIALDDAIAQEAGAASSQQPALPGKGAALADVKS